ncbi:hypothetical protein Nepgr_026812 [Nepenthes gracilis]|uniref:Uncharacterized protein n=1 Tax=Nepenthes gracilis TaxID=150966 RepID=A0AAD3T921_NEPGR|nr:hypothetical protein Nepgr_026812 [Nepenthes gracilis]
MNFSYNRKVRFTSPSPQTLVAVNPSPPLTLIVLFIRTELVALLVGCRRCARCVLQFVQFKSRALYLLSKEIV